MMKMFVSESKAKKVGCIENKVTLKSTITFTEL